MTQQSVEPVVASIQTLLGLSDTLGMTRSQRYYALWLFNDKLLSRLTNNHTGMHRASADSDESHELPLQLFAVACLLIAMEECEAEGNMHNVKTVFTAACTALDDAFSASYTSNNVFEAAAIVKTETMPRKHRLTSDYLVEMHSKIGEAALACFQGVTLEICDRVLELLYASKDYRRSQPLECGGRLLAAAIIATAFAIAVPPANVTTLPFLSWLSDLSKHPKEVVKAQSEQVLSYVLQ